MQATQDRTIELATTTAAQGGRRRRTLVSGALALALLAGGAAAALADGTDAAPRRTPGAQDDRPGPQAPDAAPPAAPLAPVADGSADEAVRADAVPAGSHDVRVLGEGWDERGRHLLVDRGRLSDGPAAEPGVDGTRPVVFDTGAVAERRRIDLADAHALRFARSGGEPSYGSGSWADLVTELGARDAGMLATVQVDADGRLISLEEPYRP